MNCELRLRARGHGERGGEGRAGAHGASNTASAPTTAAGGGDEVQIIAAASPHQELHGVPKCPSFIQLECAAAIPPMHHPVHVANEKRKKATRGTDGFDEIASCDEIVKMDISLLLFFVGSYR